MTRTFSVFVALGFIISLTVPAGAELRLDWFTVDGGGHTFSLGGALSLGGTCGQPDAGTLDGGSYVLNGGFWRGGSVLSAIPEQPLHDDLPLAFRVQAGLNNPFSDRTGIQLDLPAPERVRIRVFDHSGRFVRCLHDGVLPTGYHRLSWDGLNRVGRRVASGVYLLQVQAGRHETRRRVVFLR